METSSVSAFREIPAFAAGFRRAQMVCERSHSRFLTPGRDFRSPVSAEFFRFRDRIWWSKRVVSHRNSGAAKTIEGASTHWRARTTRGLSSATLERRSLGFSISSFGFRARTKGNRTGQVSISVPVAAIRVAAPATRFRQPRLHGSTALTLRRHASRVQSQTLNRTKKPSVHCTATGLCSCQPK